MEIQIATFKISNVSIFSILDVVMKDSYVGSMCANGCVRGSSGSVFEVVLWCSSDGYQRKEGAHDRGAK